MCSGRNQFEASSRVLLSFGSLFAQHCSSSHAFRLPGGVLIRVFSLRVATMPARWTRLVSELSGGAAYLDYADIGDLDGPGTHTEHLWV
jgi:hypothetical protein